jgi:hypothetical protein
MSLISNIPLGYVYYLQRDFVYPKISHLIELEPYSRSNTCECDCIGLAENQHLRMISPY